MVSQSGMLVRGSLSFLLSQQQPSSWVDERSCLYQDPNNVAHCLLCLLSKILHLYISLLDLCHCCGEAGSWHYSAARLSFRVEPGPGGMKLCSSATKSSESTQKTPTFDSTLERMKGVDWEREKAGWWVSYREPTMSCSTLAFAFLSFL